MTAVKIRSAQVLQSSWINSEVKWHLQWKQSELTKGIWLPARLHIKEFVCREKPWKVTYTRLNVHWPLHYFLKFLFLFLPWRLSDKVGMGELQVVVQPRFHPLVFRGTTVLHGGKATIASPHCELRLHLSSEYPVPNICGGIKREQGGERKRGIQERAPR